MEVPFYTLARQYAESKDEFLSAIDEVLTTGQVLQGKPVSDLEEQSAALCGRKYGVAVGSCTDALAFSLMAHDIGPGDEVMVTSMSFFASVSGILRVGATPRFIDIDPDFFLMRLDAMGEAITERTRAVIGVPLYGQTLAMTDFENFAKKHNLLLIEDAAQAIGSFDSGRPSGSMGDISCLSFDSMKVISSFSSAGMALTDDERIAERLRALRYHGKSSESGLFECIGFNSQMPAVMAKTLSIKLRKLESWQERRTAVANLYAQQWSEIAGLQLPQVRPGSTHNWHKFVVRVKDGKRDELRAFLEGQGVGARIHYTPLLHEHPAVTKLGLPADYVHTPTALQVKEEVLSMPMFAELTLEEAEYVAHKVRDFFTV